MQDDTSVILLASNLSQTAPRTSRFKEFAAKFSTIIENKSLAILCGLFRPIQTVKSSKICADIRQGWQFSTLKGALKTIRHCSKPPVPAQLEICQLTWADSKS